MDNTNPSAVAPQLIKVSQRQAKSCTECIRRKTRCNKQVPGCDQCLKRGIASQCRLESQFAAPSITSPLSEIEALRQSVYGEIAGLRQRIGELERVIGRRSGSDGEGTQSAVEAEGEADDAATTLEFFALGMDRRVGEQRASVVVNHDNASQARHILSEPTTYPPDTVTDSLLPLDTVTRILQFHEQKVYWQHGCVYFPHMWDEVRSFYAVIAEDEGWARVDGAWVALFYVLQAIAVHQMTDEQAVAYGLNEADRYVLPRALISSATSALYHAEFLSRPSIYTCQTLAILGVCGHNVCDSDLLSSFLAIGIKMAQTLNLHSLAKARGMDVIDAEIRKRIWWSFTMEDWYSIPFRGIWSVHPEHFDTPLPANCNDSDLAMGSGTGRIESEATIGFKSRFSSQISSTLQNAFQRLRHPSSSSFAIASEAASKIRRLISTLPVPSPSQPSWTADMRHYLLISASHKVLTIYRAFLAHAHNPSERAQAQRECLRAAEGIIEEMDTQAGSQSLWTIPYHCLAAGVVLSLELITAITKRDHKEEENRREQVEKAKRALERLAPTSRIARRGLQVLADLLRESNGKRRRGSEGMAKMVKKIKLPDDVLPESTPNSSPSPTPAPPQLDQALFTPPEYSQEDLDAFLASLQEAIPDVGRLFDGSIGSFAGHTFT